MKDREITERELEALFAKRKPKRVSWQKRLFQGLIFVLFSFIIIFVFVNFSSLKENLIYWYKTDYKNEPISGENQEDQITVTDKQKVSGDDALVKMRDNHLKISAIDVDAPITWQVENTEDSVRKNLENGLIQIKGTALPGEIGNVFITGHSSDVPWSRGQYKSIFALLNKVVIGDAAAIKYHNKSYVYKISEIKIVEPTDLSVMESSDQSILTLMTCTPVGTTLRRLIVIGKQVYPDANQNITSEVSTKPSKLPKTR